MIAIIDWVVFVTCYEEQIFISQMVVIDGSVRFQIKSSVCHEK